MIDAILAKVFGTKNKREIKAIQPLIAAINDLEPAIQQLSHTDLPPKTIEFKENLPQAPPLDDLLVDELAARAPIIARSSGTARRVLAARSISESCWMAGSRSLMAAMRG